MDSAPGARETRPDIVWFGEMPYHMEEITAALARCTLFAAIGTSGQVYPAAGFVQDAFRAGAHTVEINLEPSAVVSDFAETRFSPIDQIDSDNVGRLGVAWSWEIPRAGARLEATPLISDGVLYATGPRSYVYAVDARTGEEIWHWDPV